MRVSWAKPRSNGISYRLGLFLVGPSSSSLMSHMSASGKGKQRRKSGVESGRRQTAGGRREAGGGKGMRQA
jgi:hypothetical protein